MYYLTKFYAFLSESVKQYNMINATDYFYVQF